MLKFLLLVATRGSKIKRKGGTESWVTEETTSSELVYAFTTYCKNAGISNPYTTTSVFGSRLNNDKKLLKQGGWELISSGIR